MSLAILFHFLWAQHVSDTTQTQHKTNREQNDRCVTSTAKSQAPDDEYVNFRNILNT